jgi:hypothetical protein
VKKKTAAKVSPAEMPAVIEFLDAQAALEEFRQEHAVVFEQLAQLTERYNSCLEQAEKSCRQASVTCGPFQLYQFTTKYDPEALYNAVGREAFLELGGSVGTKVSYEVDRGRLEAAIAQGKLPEETVTVVRKETPCYRKPEKLVLP